MNDNKESDHRADVIDLAALSRPARRVVDIFDRLSKGQMPEPGSLDEALADLDAAPHPPGQLGADIDLLASGGKGGTRQNVLGAIERLRRITTVQPEAPGATVKRWRARPRQRRTRTRRKTPGQLQLPGIDDPKDATS